MKQLTRGAVGIGALATTFGLVGPLSGSGASVTPRVVPAATAKVTAASIVADINAVRKKFGLPKGTATTVYQSEVVPAARQFRDPTLNLIPPHVIQEDGVWGDVGTDGDPATLNAATIVNDWVYQDGWRGSATTNDDCTSPTAPGCNSHRRAILRKPPAAGATLSIDAYGLTRKSGGQTILAIAAVLSWSKK